MAGTNPSVLWKWKWILHQWSDEELEKVVSVNIFGTDGGADPHGALLLTTDDEVFYVGSAHPLFGGKLSALKTKVDVLSGLGLKKLAVGRDYCVALTNDQALFVWNVQTRKKISDSAYVCYELFVANTACSKCSSHQCGYKHMFNREYEFAGVKFNNGCQRCNNFLTTYGIKDSIDPKKVVKLVKFKEAAISCIKCQRRCTPYKIGEYEVNYCAFCNYLPRDAAEYYVGPFEDMASKPRLMGFGESTKIIDIACGYEFFVAHTKQNELILWGVLGDSEYQGTVYNPGKAIVKAFSCGGYHVAVVSVQGDLYTCGVGSRGQLGYKWTNEMGHETLRKVPLGEKVLKVCCGFTSTVCLMGDGSLMCFGTHMKMLSADVLVLNQQYDDYISKPARIMQTMRFVDVVNSPFTNIYFARTETLMFAWGRAFDKSRQPALVLDGGADLTAALANLPAVITFKAPCVNASTLSSPVDSDLYGKKFLSDLTLKLSDGDFPAHRLILHANSVYFRDAFGESDSDSVLDMTHYNPEAYRCLLKYFYRVPPTDLKATDLFDLYMLASSYKESDITEEVFAKLKANLNTETVLPLLQKAKEVGCSEFLNECNSFINSPEFKHILAEIVSQDLDKTVSVLEVLQLKTKN